MAQTPSHRIAEQQSAKGSTQPHGKQPPAQLLDDGLIVAIGALDLSGVVAAQLIATNADILLQLLRQASVQVLGFGWWEMHALVPALQVALESFIDLANQI